MESTSKLAHIENETFMFDFTSPDTKVDTWIESSGGTIEFIFWFLI